MRDELHRYLAERGELVRKDQAEAIRWYRRAAEAGFDLSQYNLAIAYYRGSGVERDLADATEWLLKAAAQEEENALLLLAKMHRQGEYFPRDDAKAAVYLVRARDAGSAEAIEELNRLFQPQPQACGIDEPPQIVEQIAAHQQSGAGGAEGTAKPR